MRKKRCKQLMSVAQRAAKLHGYPVAGPKDYSRSIVSRVLLGLGWKRKGEKIYRKRVVSTGVHRCYRLLKRAYNRGALNTPQDYKAIFAKAFP